ncbi:MAG: cytochrome b N-terminal domain-containing protein [Planctomycetaceae bacterium]|nr:cytochrome b N-terminal domain-containing protein [Planctomycetaceae bacterium]
MNVLLNWLDDRIGHRRILHDALYEPIPGGARWRYVWGSTLVFVFVTQMVTGFFLWTAYSPSTTTAWESVYFIQNEMSYGWLVRGIHHFAAQAMMILLGLHFLQVIIDGAYKAPREVNFWLGLILMQIVLALSLTGYLLPWDQKGYYATQVATNIAGVTPVIGPYVQQMAQGGSSYGHHTLTRFFALHAGLLPALLIVFLGAHIAVFRRHGICVPEQHAAKPAAMFWPDQILKDAVACLAVLATILYFVVTKGAELNGPADPSEAYAAARPEWYFLFLFRFLKFEEVDRLGLAFGAIYVPGAIMGVIALMPFVGRWKLGHRFNVAFTFGLLLGAAYLTVLALKEDGADVDYQSAVAEAHRDGARAVELASVEKIPPEGALALLKQDPFTQGPRLFARACASCHRYHGHDGTGRLIVETKIDEHHVKTSTDVLPTAADLGHFGSREWTIEVLTKYDAVFAPLKNIGDGKGDRFLSGDMANWSKENSAALTAAENADDLKALAEFIVQQSGRTDLGPIDAALATAGEAVFKSAMLKSGASLTSACTDCHTMKLSGAAEALSENPGAGVPTLTGYGGKEWLKAFILNPAHADYYGESNQMPPFEGKLTDAQLDLLVRWMVGDYAKTSLVIGAKASH